MTTKHTPELWDLEEIPYETNDPAGGWYLHFDPTGESTEDALYLSKAHVTPERARLIAEAPAMAEQNDHAASLIQRFLDAHARAVGTSCSCEPCRESRTWLHDNRATLARTD